MNDNQALRNEIKEAQDLLKRTSTNNNGKYLTNDEIRKELEKSHKLNKPTDKLHMMIFLIAVKFSNHRNYFNYSNKYHMIKESYIKAIQSWAKFDLEYINKEGNLTSPFSYFTNIIKFEFWNIIAKTYESKNRDFMLRYNPDGSLKKLDAIDYELEQRNNEKIALSKFNNDRSDY